MSTTPRRRRCPSCRASAVLFVSVLAAACSGGAGATPDAAPADANIGTVLVTTIRQGQPLPDAPVFFHNPDGSLLAEASSDANGPWPGSFRAISLPVVAPHVLPLSGPSNPQVSAPFGAA
jgi:hypothetical protein